MLAELAGIDLEDLEGRRRAAYEERTAINRVAKEVRAQAEGPEYQVPDDTPEEPIDAEEIAADLRKAEETNANNRALRDKLADFRERLADAEAVAGDAKIRIDAAVDAATRQGDADVEHAERLLEQARERRETMIRRARENAEAQAAEAEQRRADLAARVERGAGIVEGLEDVDADALAVRLNQAQKINRAVEFRQSRDRLVEAAEAKESRAAELTAKIEEIDDEKAKAIAAADLPIDGLGIEDGAVTWQGKPLELLSGSERLRVSVALGVATHPEIAVMLIDRWGDLDDEGRAMVREMADAAGVQIWTTIVGEKDEEITIKIRDGEVAP
jgi:hypothetical protein